MRMCDVMWAWLLSKHTSTRGVPSTRTDSENPWPDSWNARIASVTGRVTSSGKPTSAS